MQERFNPIRARAIVAVFITAAVFTAACATTQVQRSQQVSVDVHAALAAIQDSETVLNDSHAVAAWTPEKHRQFNAALVPALQAGRALNEGVRAIPVAPNAKADLATVSEALTKLDAIVAGSLPADHKVALAIHAATQAVLQLLPLFLQ